MVSDSVFGTQETAVLDVEQLAAFEIEAILKCTDFVDYLAIMADTGNARQFREKASELLSGMFVDSTSAKVKVILQGKDCPLDIDTVYCAIPFVKGSDSTYRSVVRIEFKGGPNHPDRGRHRNCPGSVDIGILLSKREKQFGTIRKKVWTTLLY